MAEETFNSIKIMKVHRIGPEPVPTEHVSKQLNVMRGSNQDDSENTDKNGVKSQDVESQKDLKEYIVEGITPRVIIYKFF